VRDPRRSHEPGTAAGCGHVLTAWRQRTWLRIVVASASGPMGANGGARRAEAAIVDTQGRSEVRSRPDLIRTKASALAIPGSWSRPVPSRLTVWIRGSCRLRKWVWRDFAPLFQPPGQPKPPIEMCEAIVPVQRLQPGHDDFYNPPVQALLDQHRWHQIASQNGRRIPK